MRVSRIKNRYIAIFALLAVITGFYTNRRSYILGHLGNFNDINVVSNGLIDERQLIVKLNTEKINPLDTIYFKGAARTIPEEYGPNKIVVNYKDSLSGLFIHWKYNRNADYVYNLAFIRSAGSLFCIFRLTGAYDLCDTIRLEPIK